MLHAPLPRLDDRRRLGGNPQEPHRRGDFRSPLRSTRTAGRCGGVRDFLLPPPLWGRVGVGGREISVRPRPIRRPPPPTPPQPNLAIATVPPLNKMTEVGNRRLP